MISMTVRERYADEKVVDWLAFIQGDEYLGSAFNLKQRESNRRPLL
jgi:hypothetical protein